MMLLCGRALLVGQDVFCGSALLVDLVVTLWSGSVGWTRCYSVVGFSWSDMMLLYARALLVNLVVTL